MNLFPNKIRKTSVIVVIIAALSIPSTRAFPWQAGHCDEGTLAGKAGAHGDEASGTIFDGPYEITVDGTALDSNKISLKANQNYTFRLQTKDGSNDKFRGFLVRLSDEKRIVNVNDAFDVSTRSSDDLKVHPACANDISAVTHRGRNDKTFVEFYFKLDEAIEELRLDVTIVQVKRTWYYSLYEVEVTSDEETSSPTSAPVTNPTSTPTSTPATRAPTSSPTSTPVTSAPTSSPTSIPVTRAPTSGPTSTSVTSAPTSRPTSTPVTRAPTSRPTSVPVTKVPTSSPMSGEPTSVLVTSLPSGTPTKPTLCIDSPLKMIVNERPRGCLWAANEKNHSKRCNKRNVGSHCPATCDDVLFSCREFASEDSKKRFVMTNSGLLKFCVWVGREEDQVEKRCTKEGVADTCRATCIDYI